ncbi:TPA: hypothetical protein ACXJNB_000302 [Serratia marcescens]
MNLVKVDWIPEHMGGRKAVPPAGKYYAVSRFPEDKEWQNNAWSVVFELEESKSENGKTFSLGTVDFLMESAPKEHMVQHVKFEIYEGPKKVADVFLINT